MQQTVTCSSCGSPINESQKFCGVCGLNLVGMIQQKATACPTCGSPMSPGQQFCGTCGTNLASVSQQPPPMAQPAPGSTAMSRGASVIAGGAPATTVVAPTAVPSGPSAARQVTKPRKRGILSAAAIIFQIFGWIILVFGILASIAMAVFAGMGGSFMPAVPSLGSLGGIAAIGVAIIGIIASLLYGLGFLAFAEICYAVMNIEKSITQVK